MQNHNSQTYGDAIAVASSMLVDGTWTKLKSPRKQ